ncbi:helix-turn-helix transcriptional regulator [Oceanobacillus massiliensis]|uniref:helix-turn-helix transcriptional regulator n=1 Tax=Oceanobacillus massiliensis TaxID=1465765 RepID=UPI000287B4CC|nr:helix-turn-helix transcriptional regulator [Oceanobacillus massiliensis]
MSNVKVLSNRIRVFRAERKMTQKELAEKVGVSRQTIISTEKGNYTPSLILAFDIANIFNVRVDEVFQYEKTREEL